MATVVDIEARFSVSGTIEVDPNPRGPSGVIITCKLGEAEHVFGSTIIHVGSD
jgi:hypothetical protein